MSRAKLRLMRLPRPISWQQCFPTPLDKILPPVLPGAAVVAEGDAVAVDDDPFPSMTQNLAHKTVLGTHRCRSIKVLNVFQGSFLDDDLVGAKNVIDIEMLCAVDH